LYLLTHAGFLAKSVLCHNAHINLGLNVVSPLHEVLLSARWATTLQ